MPAGFDSYHDVAARAPQPHTTNTPCGHRDVDWAYVVEDRGPVSVLEGDCVECGCVVRGEQRGRGGEIVDRERAH